jgi:hypothetical protein
VTVIGIANQTQGNVSGSINQTQGCLSSTNQTQDPIYSSTITVPIGVGLGIGVLFTIASITLGYLYLRERKRTKVRELSISSDLQHGRSIASNIPSREADGQPILRELQ